MNTRLAFRNIFRNRWRSLLTAGGIATAVGMLIWVNCMNEGFIDLMVENAISKQLGDVQLQSAEYIEEPSIFHAMDGDEVALDAIRQTVGVEGASARIYGFALVGHERRSVVGQLIGVDPAAEDSVSGVGGGMREGVWLSPEPAPVPGPRQAVLGKTIAKQLQVAVGEELVFFLQAADGSLGNDVLEVVGITGTGNSSLDRMAVYMHLADVQYATALAGKVHEVAVNVLKGHDTRVVAAAIRAHNPSPGEAGASSAPVVRPWQEIMPEFEGLIEFARGQAWFMYFIIGLIAALGILNTQRMSVLERRREFGVLLAIGLAPRKLGGVVVAEAVILTAFGALLGILWGGGLSWYHTVAGFDFAAFSDQIQGFEFGGMSMESRMYFIMTPQAVLEPALVLVAIAGLCGLWPAWAAARLDAVRAISGRT